MKVRVATPMATPRMSVGEIFMKGNLYWGLQDRRDIMVPFGMYMLSLIRMMLPSAAPRGSVMLGKMV